MCNPIGRGQPVSFCVRLGLSGVNSVSQALTEPSARACARVTDNFLQWRAAGFGGCLLPQTPVCGLQGEAAMRLPTPASQEGGSLASQPLSASPGRKLPSSGRRK